LYQHKDIRELLIETYYSNDLAVQYFEERLNDKELFKLLVRIAIDDEDYSGDAPMAAGDYLYKFPLEWIREYETDFLKILKREYSDVRSEDIAMALAKIKSVKAKSLILSEIEELGYGPRYDRFKEALLLYSE
jgi:hypothetical protein